MPTVVFSGISHRWRLTWVNTSIRKTGVQQAVDMLCLLLAVALVLAFALTSCGLWMWFFMSVLAAMIAPRVI